jgi:hypothetical protein
MNDLHTRTFRANGAIGWWRIVAPHASVAGDVIQAAAATAALIGVCVQPKGALTTERCDVQLAGEVMIEAGAAFAAGAMLTSDAQGRAVTAAPAAGVNNRIIGVALEAAAAAGDQCRVLLNQCSLQG